MKFCSERHREVEKEIDRLTRELLAREVDPRRPPPAIVRAYQLLIEHGDRRLDELGRY